MKKIDKAIQGVLEVGDTFTYKGLKLTYDDYDEEGAYCYDIHGNWYLISYDTERGYYRIKSIDPDEE